MPLARVLPASHFRTEHAPNTEFFDLKLLAQGDSWFSINGLSLFTASSVLSRLKFSKDALIVNCAFPGDTLTHMVDWRRDPFFFRYFASPTLEEKWDGLLLSAGGNDLIDAIGVLPKDANGVPRMMSERLLLTRDERPGNGPIDRYISPDGWAVFRQHMLEQYRALGVIRAESRENKDTPIFTHCYANAQPRDVGAGPLGPWLHPALVAYQVPTADWLLLTKHFIGLLHDEIITMTGLSNFHVLDTRDMIPVAPADPKVKDPNWLNEIHPTARGYDLLAPEFVDLVERGVI